MNTCQPYHRLYHHHYEKGRIPLGSAYGSIFAYISTFQYLVTQANVNFPSPLHRDGAEIAQIAHGIKRYSEHVSPPKFRPEDYYIVYIDCFRENDCLLSNFSAHIGTKSISSRE